MNKIKAIAAGLAAIMSVSLLASCAGGIGSATVVKEDDPWYDSSRFLIERDKNPSEFIQGKCVAASDEYVYYLYSLYDVVNWEACRRTVMDTYDYSGKLVSRKEIDDSSFNVIDVVQDIRLCDDGKTAELIAVTWGDQSFQSARLTLDLENAKITNEVRFSDDNGNNIEIGDYGVSQAAFVGDYCVATIFTSDDTYFFLFKGDDYIGQLDMSQVEPLFNFEPFSYDAGTDTLSVIGLSYSGYDVLLKFDPSDCSLKSQGQLDLTDNDIDPADYQVTDTGDLCRIDTLGNITRLGTESGTAETVIDNTWYSPYFSDLAGKNMLLTATAEKAIIVSTVSNLGTSIDPMADFDYITVLTKAEKNPHAGKQVIEIAMPLTEEVSVYLSNAIYEFNKTDDEYLIRIWSKYKTGFKVGRDFGNINIDDEKQFTMIQELKGSEAPDLAIGIQLNYAMRDDIFMDLTGFLDQSVMDKQYTNIIEASKIGGKQYFLPVTLEIEGLVTNKALLPEGAVGITFEEYDKMVKEDLNGYSPYEYPMSAFNNKVTFILSCIDTKAAIEGDTVDFGTDQFYAAVEYANDNFIYDDYESTPIEYLEDWDTKVRGESIYVRCRNYLDFICACYSSDGDYAFIGTPSVDASGPRFRALETISVAASTDQSEGCKKFLNFLFSGAGISSGSTELSDIITNKEIMESTIPAITEAHNEELSAKIECDNATIELEFYHDKIASESMQQSFLDCLATSSTYYYEDPRIVTFVIEETQAYYAGDVTLDKVVEYINDRASKYVKEM